MQRSHRPLTGGLAKLAKRLRQALVCPTCHKRTSVANVAGYRQRVQLEVVTPETHCTCPGGPAHSMRDRSTDAHSPGDARCGFCDGSMPCHCPEPSWSRAGDDDELFGRRIENE